MRYLIFCALIPAVSAFAASQPSAISGDYVEVRSNHVYGCYCEWSGEAITSGREVILGWDIHEGGFQGIPLAGVKAVAVVVGEASLSAGPGRRSSVLFLDSAAREEQHQAALALLRERYGEFLGDIRKVHKMPVSFHREEDAAGFAVGEEVNVAMRRSRLPEDAMKGATHWYDPFFPLAEFTMGTTLFNSYQGRDFDRRWDLTEPAITGYYGRFSLPSR
jgi:hypothetical protein